MEVEGDGEVEDGERGSGAEGGDGRERANTRQAINGPPSLAQ